jgi:hypothetical protein
MMFTEKGRPNTSDFTAELINASILMIDLPLTNPTELIDLLDEVKTAGVRNLLKSINCDRGI